MDLFWTGRDGGRYVHIDSRIAAGSALVFLGLVLTALSFRAHPAWSVEWLWPMLVVGFGVSRVVEPSGRVEGSVLLFVGGGVLLSNAGLFVLPEHWVVRFWPLLVVFVGLWELVFHPEIGMVPEGLATMSLGVLLQLSYFGANHITSYRAWPLILPAIGGGMIVRSLSTQRHGRSEARR